MQHINRSITDKNFMDSSVQEILSFYLDDEEYGVDILSVKEIRVWSSATKIPNTPSYLKGVINLRGLIIPIVDLSERFNRGTKKYDGNNRRHRAANQHR